MFESLRRACPPAAALCKEDLSRNRINHISAACKLREIFTAQLSSLRIMSFPHYAGAPVATYDHATLQQHSSSSTESASLEIFSIPSPCSSPNKQQQQQHREREQQQIYQQPAPLMLSFASNSFDIPIHPTSPLFPAQLAAASPPSPVSDTGGLGIVFTTSGSEIRVKKCVPGGPADVSQAIKQGDILLKIDGFNCVGSSIKDIQPRVRLCPIRSSCFCSLIHVCRWLGRPTASAL